MHFFLGTFLPLKLMICFTNYDRKLSLFLIVGQAYKKFSQCLNKVFCFSLQFQELIQPALYTFFRCKGPARLGGGWGDLFFCPFPQTIGLIYQTFNLCFCSNLGLNTSHLRFLTLIDLKKGKNLTFISTLSPSLIPYVNPTSRT